MSESATTQMAESLSLTETVAQPQLRVDRENHVIYGVKLLGDTSKNKHPVSGKPYKYSDSAMQGFAALQEGARVYIDHRPPGDNSPRKYADQFGDFRDVKAMLATTPRGNFGNLHYNPAHPLTEQILHDAEHAPHRLAMSHVALGAGKAQGDWHRVEEAKAVESVDLVCRGATNVSLFEGLAPTIEPPRAPKPKDDTMAIEKLTEELKAANERIAKLEADIALNEAREKRKAQAATAGVTLSEGLLDHLATCDDSAATLIIEGMRPAAAAPKSRDPNHPPKAIESAADFCKLL